MLRLQGMDPSTFVKVVTDKEIGHQICNAMSVNVVERLILQVLNATAIHGKERIEDRWSDGRAIERIVCEKSQRLPEHVVTNAGNRRSKIQ